ncbi:MAG: hypothetical protein Q8S24_00715 [Eubacteriales bacterium]|nr:hypothetical protein [Eubacteriales bacterium]
MCKKNRLRVILISIMVVLLISTGCMSKQEKEEINQVIEAIDKISAITLDSEANIKIIITAFENLSEKQKKEITNQTTLFNAKNELDKLKDEENQRLEAERQRLEEERLRLEEAMNECVKVAELISEGLFESAINHYNDLSDETLKVGKDKIDEAFNIAVEINKVRGSFDKVLPTLGIFHELAYLGNVLAIDETSEYYESIQYIQEVLAFEEKYSPYKAAIDLYMSDDVSILTGSILNASKYLEPEKWGEALPFLEQSIAIMNKIDFAKYGFENYGIQEAEDVKKEYIESLNQIMLAILAMDLAGVETGINSFFEVSQKVMAFNEELTGIIDRMRSDLKLVQ